MRIEVANSQFVTQRTTSKKKAFLWNQKTRVVPYHIGSQSLKREKAHQAKTYKGGLRKLGHPADSDPENGDSQAKVRDNKSKSK